MPGAILLAFQQILGLFQTLLISTPSSTSPWAPLALWLARLLALALLTRTYLAPVAVTLLSKRVRVRSISLRSVRGLYLRVGGGTVLSCERIKLGARWVSQDRAIRITVTVQNLRVELPKQPSPGSRLQSSALAKRRQHRRMPTLKDFDPSPHAWSFVSSTTAWFTRTIRPAVTTAVIVTLRLTVLALPTLTQVFEIELDQIAVSSQALDNARLSFTHAGLSSRLEFFPVGDGSGSVVGSSGTSPAAQRSLAGKITAWWHFLSMRNRERAWSSTQCVAKFSLRITNIVACAPSHSQPSGRLPPEFRGLPDGAFMTLPQGVQIDLSAGISMSTLTVEPRSVDASFNFGEVHVEVDSLHKLIRRVRSFNVPTEASGDELGDVLSPASSDTEMTSPTSPRSSRRFSAFEAFSNFRKASKTPLHKQTKPPPIWMTYLSTLHAQSTGLVVISNGSISARLKTQPVSIKLNASEPSKSVLHREILGKDSLVDWEHREVAYNFEISIRQISVIRSGSTADSVPYDLRVLNTGPFILAGLFQNWPASLVARTPFLEGDPNAALLAIQITLGNVVIMERLDFLLAVLSKNHSTVQDPLQSPLLSPPITPTPPSAIPPSTVKLSRSISHIPRLRVQARIEDVSITLLTSSSADAPSNDETAFEFKTGGYSLSANSCFTSSGIPKTFAANIRERMYSITPVNAEFSVTSELQSLSLSVRGNSDNGEDTPVEPLLLIDPLEVSCSGSALGYITDDRASIVTIDTSTAMTDILFATTALSIELWSPTVISGVHSLLALLAAPKTKDSQPLSMNATQPREGSAISKLPFGITAKIGIQRFTAIVTAPDINPNDSMELSRGVALHTSIALTYCALRHDHLSQAQPFIARGSVRQRLQLPPDLVPHAATSARTSRITNQDAAFAQLAFRNVVLRTAVSTPFAADDPYGERLGEPSIEHSIALRIPSITADVTVRKQSSTSLILPDICGVNVVVPAIKGTWRLAHAYSILLALRRLKSLKPEPNLDGKALSSSQQPYLSISGAGIVETIQIVLALPNQQQFYLRANNVELRNPTSGGEVVRVRELCAFVPKYNEDVWERLACIQSLSVTPARLPDLPINISIDGGACVHVPHNFLFNELIRSVTVSVKALKHLIHVITAGAWSEMGAPEAEDAKHIPKINIRVRILTFEAADDPFETKLSLIWSTGLAAARVREEREAAFEAKAATIIATENLSSSTTATSPTFRKDYQFTAKHNVSIQDARQRLNQVHSMDWIARHQGAEQEQSLQEETLQNTLWENHSYDGHLSFDPVTILPVEHTPPLFRMMARELNASVGPPSFPFPQLPDFLFEKGGMPTDTQYSLLVPLGLVLSAASLRLSLRDYPLPLVNIPPAFDTDAATIEIRTNLVVAEEMGLPDSVDWVHCVVAEQSADVLGAAELSLSVPKTLMPVKTYAEPIIKISASDATDLAWGVSYGPALQDVMRVVDNLTSPPRDPSPALGFWDKMRLQLHCKARIDFRGDVHLHFKGSRDPSAISGEAAGLALCWTGSPQLNIGYRPEDHELIQVRSDEMLIVIPDLEAPTNHSWLDADDESVDSATTSSRKFRKVCAKFGGGVCFGIGAVLERTCRADCEKLCAGPPFGRCCRFFDFKPHYQVFLRNEGFRDSYEGFRSDFIHLSVSLTSSLKNSGSRKFSSFHLNPAVFAHFWSWWHLFDRTLSLQIRQGNLWSKGVGATKTPSPKFGKHLATIKYRITVPNLFICHVYIDESKDAWSSGTTPFVGLKALITYFHADLHQREEETLIPGLTPGTSRIIQRKAFNAAEVVMKGIDLRVLLAIFRDPIKESIAIDTTTQSTGYRVKDNIPAMERHSFWIDNDDFVETDWSPRSKDKVHLLPAATCPHFTYFKRARETHQHKTRPGIVGTKFGDEDSHVCLLEKEASVSQIQIDFALERIEQLRNKSHGGSYFEKPARDNDSVYSEAHGSGKMITLLEDYIAQLRLAETDMDQSTNHRTNYHMPSDLVQPHEWTDFNNVYQVHNPTIHMNNTVRDILMQYYYCSRARRGFEYHMAARAVKFIRDQAENTIAVLKSDKKKGRAATGAHQAAQVIKKMLNVDSGDQSSVIFTDEPGLGPSDTPDPLKGWSGGVSVDKSHFLLLLKPQIVLKSESDDQSVCVLAAVQAKSQAFGIVDDLNADDPISGRVMTRSYTSLSGLQMFSPASSEGFGDHPVPLEVLIDLRCESSDFDRLVPQTDASFHYDKFNKLRLRNTFTSVVHTSEANYNNHLQHQTDLIRVHVPNFTVGANDKHFHSIADIMTHLVLYSDAAHKTRSEKLETFLFSYDFSDLSSAADVVVSLQNRLRDAVETAKSQESRLLALGEYGRTEMLRLKAHTLTIAEELTFIFDAIKLAQDKVEDHHDQKSALLLRASSQEISWRMLDPAGALLAKLAVRDLDFSWLSRQDSSTVNKLVVGDLQAFAGSPKAVWAEIISKHDEPSNHPLLKRGCFLVASWTLLPPVGGIAIYENFEVMLHPIRLQIDTTMGGSLLEYIWPERKKRRQSSTGSDSPTSRMRKVADSAASSRTRLTGSGRVSLDSPRATENGTKSLEQDRLAPPLRRVGTSRSFTDLRSASKEPQPTIPPLRQRTTSFGPQTALSTASDNENHVSHSKRKQDDHGDAEEMKSRSSQKSFVLVKVGSLHLLLSVWKEQSFVCRDARIQTRDLEYHNQTLSFEELVDQFIPSDPSWKGWIKLAFQQPLIPVLPVARELFSKTKWIARKGGNMLDPGRALPHSPNLSSEVSRNVKSAPTSPAIEDDHGGFQPFASALKSQTQITGQLSSDQDSTQQPQSRNKVLRLFRRNKQSVDLTEPQSPELERTSIEPVVRPPSQDSYRS